MITITEARGLATGAPIQCNKRGTWMPAKFLALDSSDRLWIEEPSPESIRGFEVCAVQFEAVRLIPVQVSGCVGASIRYHGRGSDPSNCIYTFRTRTDAEAWVAQQYGSTINSDFIEFVELPPIVLGRTS